MENVLSQTRTDPLGVICAFPLCYAGLEVGRMYWDSWIREIRGGILAPVYVLGGPETYVARMVVEELENACGLSAPELNLGRYDLSETPIQQVVLEARTTPFFSDRRLVIATGGEALSGRSKVPHDLTSWEEYVADPSPTAVVVLLFGDHKMDERKKWVRRVKETGRWWMCPSPKESELTAWVNKEVQRRGFHMGADAVNRLILLSGGHLELIAGELDKLSLYAPGKAISREDVDLLVVPFPEQDIFRWVDDVVRLDMDRALTGLDRLLKQKENPFKLLMLLARQFRLMYHALNEYKSGHVNTDLSAQLGVRPYALKIALEQGRRYTLRQLSDVLQWLADADSDIKTGRRTDRAALNDFVVTLPIRLKGGEWNAPKTPNPRAGSPSRPGSVKA
ncbi:DNA polymerase III subunit delta [Kyrpidia spormannii]|uniref:DNA polymerase III subunit delta n=1 Tax=Kyrpidia spormannii TaxID=2055160 RepID=A0ACA8ZDW9_9BACL|nr:DNA polymerase III subunit delta [Kyrpidia spormannii]CAB3392991.1 DNA polymerase III subunit delta [Kyrpidia spormannii]